MKIKKKKALTCPACGSASVARILWGMPAWDRQMAKDEKAGKIFIGGCCVTGHNPKWHCNKCGHDWGRVRIDI